MPAKTSVILPIRIKIVEAIRLDNSLTPFICQCIHIWMPFGYLIWIVTMIPNLLRAMSCHTLEAIDSIQLSKSSILPQESWVKAKNIDKPMAKEVKKVTGHFSTVRWDFSRNGTMNKIHRLNKKLRISWKLSIGKLLAEDLLSMMKVVLIMMTSLKIFKLVSISWKISLTILQRQQSQQTHLDIHRLLWPFWLIWVFRDFLSKDPMSIFFCKTRLNSFGKLSQQTDNTMVLFRLTLDGPFMDFKISSQVVERLMDFAHQNKCTSITWEGKTNFWNEFCTVLTSWGTLGMISNNSMNIPMQWSKLLWKSFLLKDATK